MTKSSDISANVKKVSNKLVTATARNNANRATSLQEVGKKTWDDNVLPALSEAYNRVGSAVYYPYFDFLQPEQQTGLDQGIYNHAIKKTVRESSYFTNYSPVAVAMNSLSDAFACERWIRGGLEVHSYAYTDIDGTQHPLTSGRDSGVVSSETLEAKVKNELFNYYKYRQREEPDFEHPEIEVAISSYQAGVAAAAVHIVLDDYPLDRRVMP